MRKKLLTILRIRLVFVLALFAFALTPATGGASLLDDVIRHTRPYEDGLTEFMKGVQEGSIHVGKTFNLADPADRAIASSVGYLRTHVPKKTALLLEHGNNVTGLDPDSVNDHVRYLKNSSYDDALAVVCRGGACTAVYPMPAAGRIARGAQKPVTGFVPMIGVEGTSRGRIRMTFGIDAGQPILDPDSYPRRFVPEANSRSVNVERPTMAQVFPDTRAISTEVIEVSDEVASRYASRSGSKIRRGLTELGDGLGRVPMGRLIFMTAVGVAIEIGVRDWVLDRGGNDFVAEFSGLIAGELGTALIEIGLFRTPPLKAFSSSVWVGFIYVAMLGYEVNCAVHARINEPGFNGFTPEEDDAWLMHIDKHGLDYWKAATAGFFRSHARYWSQLF